jgi:hypothetical protein
MTCAIYSLNNHNKMILQDSPDIELNSLLLKRFMNERRQNTNTNKHKASFKTV